MLTTNIQQSIRSIQLKIKNALPNYRVRQGQNQLIAEIAHTIAGSYHRHHRIALVEAGTGTGKSLAYLLACIPYVLTHNKTLVIATATVALQEQLVRKDLPFFQQHSGLDFEFCLVKGRQRYACIERLQELLQQPELFPDSSVKHQATASKLLKAWQQRHWLGDSDSLPFTVPDALWQQIQADPYHCHRGSRRHQHCPFHLARAEITGSQVLVTNQAFLLADLEAGSAQLPAPEDCVYVIDEGHHLVESARSFLSASAPLLQQELWLEKALKFSQRMQANLPESALKAAIKLQELIDDYRRDYQPVKLQLPAFITAWFNDKPQHRFTDAALPLLLSQQAESLARSSRQVLNQLELLHQKVREAIVEQQFPTRAISSTLQDFSSFDQKFSQQQALWQLWAEQQGTQVYQARWVEQPEQQTQQVIGYASPLRVQAQLERLLFRPAFACVLCSATLTALNSFNYPLRELGLDQLEGVRTLKVESPFAYAEQGQILLPKMQHEPTAEGFTAELCQQLPDFLPKGQASLVLFASYWQMNEVAKALRGKGFELLVQGEAARQKLLEQHQQNVSQQKTSILFGTQSFAEGLDLPGQLLTNLVITKLPFAVPTSPLEEAMSEAVSKQGGNPFLQLTVPATAKKLVQACGRLLRQEQDSGQIVILDRRLVSKTYGKAMLDALPPFKRSIHY
ncbi:ATP-dependent DNA helicase DinG [Alkalimonas sp. MEB108]|uniref:ATP-dependent DNA helicase DinG n=1 Tax=Alkalimonas cellulosilytica TaxID=3058395 RepID=A0ABU7J5H9_9GAMM|nr:ATP-dependent DNA helicase DinG [Alkalimonas sp. MEB108]MEE2001669.1 ATP-dependent DNA helicase DinG [Alkalimonas sp. MEB108]